MRSYAFSLSPFSCSYLSKLVNVAFPKCSANEKGRGRLVEHPSPVARNALEDVPYAHLGDPSPTLEASSRARIADHPCTATGLILTGTQWTKRHRQIIENRIDKRNFRTH